MMNTRTYQNRKKYIALAVVLFVTLLFTLVNINARSQEAWLQEALTQEMGNGQYTQTVAPRTME